MSGRLGNWLLNNIFVDVGIQAEYCINPNLSKCTVLFNMIQLLNVLFDFILVWGDMSLISISISISISTQPPSSAEFESVRSQTPIFHLCFRDMYWINLPFITIKIIIIICNTLS
jgi:hypothetical protein